MNDYQENELWQEAKRLASRPYAMEEIELDREEREKFPEDICVSNPELPGCYSEGSSWEEAQENLRQARELYIFTLLKNGEGVPAPHRTIEVVQNKNLIINFANPQAQHSGLIHELSIGPNQQRSEFRELTAR